MLLESLFKRFGIRSAAVRLYAGSASCALLISLGMVGGAELLGVRLGPALPAAFGAIGAALFASRQRYLPPA